MDNFAFNAPQFVDFQSPHEEDAENSESYFDFDHELHSIAPCTAKQNRSMTNKPEQVKIGLKVRSNSVDNFKKIEPKLRTSSQEDLRSTRQNSKYVSMAECISNFQKCVRSQSKVEPLKHSVLVGVTIPQSPLLHTKQRGTRLTYNKAEEQKNVSDTNKFKIKTHQAGKKIASAPLKATLPVGASATPLVGPKPCSSSVELTTKKTITTPRGASSVDSLSSGSPSRSRTFNLKSTSVSGTVIKPFSFEERNKQIIKKREELVNKVLQEEKKAREFHARPATVLHSKPFEPKKPDKPLTEITHFELNTDKRAKEREEFEESMKRRQELLSQLQKQREEEDLRKEKEQIARMRKQAEHKANPIRHYREMEIKEARKITVPISPKFASAYLKNKENTSGVKKLE